MPTPFAHLRDTVGPPGRYVSFVGNLGTTPVPLIQRIDGSSAPNAATATTLTPTTQSTDCVQFRVPTTLERGLYAAWVRDSSDAATSAQYWLNQAEPWYVEYDQAIADQTVMRIFGKNLKLPGVTPTIRFNNGASNFQAAMDVAGSTENILRFVAPAGLATGTAYTLFVNNGYGGSYGDVAVLSGQTVTARVLGNGDPYAFNVPWAGDFNYTVRSTQPAGASQSTVQTALDAADSAGGGVVRLSAGAYSGNLIIPTTVILKGPDPGNGTATVTGKISFGNKDLGGGSFSPSDLSGLVDITNVTTVSWGAPKPGATKVVVHRVSSTHTLGDAHCWEPKGLTHFLLSAWTQVANTTGPNAGRPFNMARSGTAYNTYIHVRDYNCRWLNFRIHIQDMRYGTVERSRLHRDFTIRTYTGLDSGGWNLEAVQYSWWLDEIYDTVGTYGPTGTIKMKNDGETWTTQGLADHNVFRVYWGLAASATSTSVTMPGSAMPTNTVNVNASEYWAFILDGKGRGQARRISGVAGNLMTVTPAWDVVPDTTSMLILWRLDAHRIGMTTCLFDRVIRGIWVYTGGMDLVFSENTFIASELWLRGYQRNGGGSGQADAESAPIWRVYTYNNRFSTPSNLSIDDLGFAGDWRLSAGHITYHNPHATAGSNYLGWWIACMSHVLNGLDALPQSRAGGGGPGASYTEGYTLAIEDENGGDQLGGRDSNTVTVVGVVYQGNHAQDSTQPYTRGSTMKGVLHAAFAGQTAVTGLTTTNSAGGLAFSNGAVIAGASTRERIIDATAALSAVGAPAATYDTMLSTTLLSKLVARYRFDDISGPLVDDKGTGNFAVTPTVQYAQTSNVVALPGSTSVTMGAGGFGQVAPAGWPTGNFELHLSVFRPTGLVWNTIFAWPRGRLTWRNDDLLYFEQWNAADTLVLRAGNGAGAGITSAGAIHHVSISRVGAAMEIRVDNALKPNAGSQTGSDNDPLWAFVGTLNARAANATRIGQDGTSNIGGADQAQGARVDELLVFNAPLTTPERDGLYAAWATAPSGTPTTVTRTVPATVAIRDTEIRVVPPTAAIQGFRSIGLPSTVSLAASPRRIVPLIAALSVAGLTRVVSATAAVRFIGSRQLPVTAALGATPIRVVGASAAIQGFRSIGLPTTAAVTVVGTPSPRGVLASVALSRANLLRTLSSVTAVLGTTGSRSIPSTAAITRTTTRTVPASASTLSVLNTNVTTGTFAKAPRVGGAFVRAPRTVGAFGEAT